MPSLNALAKENRDLIGFWFVSLGFAAGCGTIAWSIGANGTSISDNKSTIEELMIRANSHEIQYVQLKSEVIRNREIFALRFDNFEKILESVE